MILGQIKDLNRSCYKQQLQLTALLNYAQNLIYNREKPFKKWLCTDTTRSISSSHLFFMKLLLSIRDSTKLFVLLVKEIEQQNLDEEQVQEIAEDFIKLFFVDFAVSEHGDVRTLKVFEELLKTCLAESVDAWYSYRPFVNKLLEAYFDRIENREYLKLIFRKELNGISLTVKEMEAEEVSPEKPPVEFNPNYIVISSDEQNAEKEEKLTIEEVNYKELEKEVKAETAALESGETSASKDEKKESKSEDIEELKEAVNIIDYPDEVYQICSKFVWGITTKLLYMPLSVRHLCKLTQKLCNELFKEDTISLLYKVLEDLLYHCWWKHALLHPSGYDIIKISLGRSSSVKKKVASASELLMRVLYGDRLAETINYAPKLTEFIRIKNEVVEEYLNELLNIDLPVLEIAESEEDSLDIASTCVSIKTMRIIYSTLTARKQEVKEISEMAEKYLSRIAFIIDNPILPAKSSELFALDENSFDVDAMSDPLSHVKEKFGSSMHYVLFQEVSVKAKQKVTIFTESWELLLDKLLPKIDLSGCYDNSYSGKESGIEFISFLKQIAEYPSGFLVNGDDSNAVRVLAMSLLEYFEGKDKKTIKESIESVKDAYAKTSQMFLEKQQRVKCNLREAVTALKNKLGFVQEMTTKVREEIVCRLHAERFIKGFLINFDMQKESSLKGSPEEWRLSLHKAGGEAITNKDIARMILFGSKKKLSKSKRTSTDKKIKK
eukprot:TRINITY_DN8425_c0_g3_i2.p1 TRINITY_DN8425_c0_g3~~TRINITY_DN8425_c0_g3_i2.p1  ORF type:complete len:722 (-),score=191.06 TRINITY_DN8425_c0_g3_i2:934-3099(-)